jgi:hypothetical protein
MFVYPEMTCDGKRGVIIGQPIRMVTSWEASPFEHTSSVDERAILKSRNGRSDENDPLSVGLVVVQKRKLLTHRHTRTIILVLGHLPYIGNRKSD